MSGVVYLMDTSFMLELEGIPGHSAKERRCEAVAKMQEVLSDTGAVIVTAPVLLEYAGFLARLKDNYVRRKKAVDFLSHIRDSLVDNGPWTISGARNSNYLLKTGDIIALGERFASDEGNVYSFVDLSVIQEAEEQKRRCRQVRMLTFDKKLKAWESKS